MSLFPCAYSTNLLCICFVQLKYKHLIEGIRFREFYLKGCASPNYVQLRRDRDLNKKYRRRLFGDGYWLSMFGCPIDKFFMMSKECPNSDVVRRDIRLSSAHPMAVGSDVRVGRVGLVTDILWTSVCYQGHPRSQPGRSKTHVINDSARVFANPQERENWLRRKNKRIVSIEKQLQIAEGDGVQSFLAIFSENVYEGRKTFGLSRRS